MVYIVITFDRIWKETKIQHVCASKEKAQYFVNKYEKQNFANVWIEAHELE